MNTITISRVTDEEAAQYSAVSGNRVSSGKTMGEALDALLAQKNGQAGPTLVVVQKQEPDAFFTEEQHLRQRELMRRRDTLNEAERMELEALVDAELAATIARAKAMVRQLGL